ncbi:DUF1449 family protein [Verrucomicrobiales bacterium]|jgi:hypothetical protein|nr:DUF1449 family protein [Verrucomicrobiales bacterium]MDB4589528.1 DUF1449 family protein [Verrucomicrobiales bacterium]MDC0504427.1 DUF1449 family protein [Verrucomicrobiales bacterium]MDF1784527.1 DUF1449 family protein [Verrucomicrobiales bacterium]
MSELLQESLRFYNFPITVCFVLVVLFWMITVFGIVDSDALEPNLDLDADVDVDAQVHGGSIGLGLLRFFNLGEVPLMILLSVLITLVWAGAVALNYYFNPGQSFLIAGGWLFANGVVSLLLTKFLTVPLKPLMRKLKEGEKHRPVIGRACVIKTSEVTETFGQAEAEDDSGNPLLLHVRVSQGQKSLAKGDRALVVDTLDDAQTYVVRKLES